MPRRTHIPAARVTRALRVTGRSPRSAAAAVAPARARIRSTAGFTLGEVLITVLLVGLLTGAVAAGIGTAINVYNDIRGHADAQGILNNAVTAVTDELRFAYDVESLSSGATGDVNLYAFDSATRDYRLCLSNAPLTSGVSATSPSRIYINAVTTDLSQNDTTTPTYLGSTPLPLLNTAANSGDSSATGNAYNVQLTQLSWDSSTRLWQFALEVTSADGTYTTNTGDTPITVRALNTW